MIRLPLLSRKNIIIFFSSQITPHISTSRGNKRSHDETIFRTSWQSWQSNNLETTKNNKLDASGSEEAVLEEESSSNFEEPDLTPKRFKGKLTKCLPH